MQPKFIGRENEGLLCRFSNSRIRTVSFKSIEKLKPLSLDFENDWYSVEIENNCKTNAWEKYLVVKNNIGRILLLIKANKKFTRESINQLLNNPPRLNFFEWPKTDMLTQINIIEKSKVNLRYFKFAQGTISIISLIILLYLSIIRQIQFQITFTFLFVSILLIGLTTNTIISTSKLEKILVKIKLIAEDENINLN